MRSWNTCFTTRRAPPCQGDGFWLAATSKAGTSKPVTYHRRRCLSPISAVDLMSKELGRPPSSRAWGLRPAALRDLYWASYPARLYRTRHKPSTKALASRCRHDQPRVMNRFGAGFTSCDLSSLQPFQGAAWSPGRTRTGVISLVRDETAKPLTFRIPH